MNLSPPARGARQNATRAPHRDRPWPGSPYEDAPRGRARALNLVRGPASGAATGPVLGSLSVDYFCAMRAGIGGRTVVGRSARAERTRSFQGGFAAVWRNPAPRTATNTRRSRGPRRCDSLRNARAGSRVVGASTRGEAGGVELRVPPRSGSRVPAHRQAACDRWFVRSP